MLTVWPASYVNYVPTNDLVLVARYWKPSRDEEHERRDDEAVSVLRAAFPGRDVIQVYIENVNRGGGGMNCITQQQPASAAFAQGCGWARLKVGEPNATLYAEPTGSQVLATVSRLDTTGEDVYLRVRSRGQDRVDVEVTGGSSVAGTTGWIDAAAIEAAGERCPEVAAT
jgi:hypothetical protein